MQFSRRDRYASVVLVAALVAVVLVVLIRTDGSEPNNLVYHYQNLLAGLIALVAAGVSVRAIWQQTESAEEIERQRRERQHLATRAVLPMAAASILEYVERLNGILEHLFYHVPQPRSPFYPHLPQLPGVPDNSIQALKEFVQASPPHIGTGVAKLLSELQILISNVEAHVREAESGSKIFQFNLCVYGARAANVYARAESMLLYARFEEDVLPSTISADWIEKAAQLLNRSGHFEHEVLDRVQKLYSN